MLPLPPLQGWPEVTARELLETFHITVSKLYVGMGKCKGETMLPLPQADILVRNVRTFRFSPALPPVHPPYLRLPPCTPYLRLPPCTAPPAPHCEREERREAVASGRSADVGLPFLSGATARAAEHGQA